MRHQGTIHKWHQFGGGRGVSENLTKVNIGVEGVPYKVDINHDSLNDWGKEVKKTKI